MLNLLPLITSLFLLDGNQVMNLDLHVMQLGEPKHQEYASAFLGAKFRTPAQPVNCAILAASLDWDVIPLLPASITNASSLRVYGQFFVSVPNNPNQEKFLAKYVDSWNTNWTASTVEENVLKRLAIQNPEQASGFFDKLSVNKANEPYTRWYTWYSLIKNRKKSEAWTYQQSHSFDPEIHASSTFTIPDRVLPKLGVIWPSATVTELYYYAFGQKVWAPTVIAKPEKPMVIASSWSRPEKTTYYRTWIPGPAWQITYSATNGVITRTANYVENNSYIRGTITGPSAFSEEILQEGNPKGISSKYGNFIQIEQNK